MSLQNAIEIAEGNLRDAKLDWEDFCREKDELEEPVDENDTEVTVQHSVMEALIVAAKVQVARSDGARGGEPEAPGESVHERLMRQGAARDYAGALATLRTLYASPAEPSGWRPIDQAPDLGRKIVALYGDGSGASMFWRHDGGYIDADGDELDELPDHYALWTYLPDSFQFWCECRSDEPMTLRIPPTSEGGGA